MKASSNNLLSIIKGPRQFVIPIISVHTVGNWFNAINC